MSGDEEVCSHPSCGQPAGHAVHALGARGLLAHDFYAAPSPSIPDPSDEARRTAIGAIRKASFDSPRATSNSEWERRIVGILDAFAAAARPTSLPEAPEPGTRETLCLRCKSGAGRHGGAVGFICGVCLAPSAPPVAVDPEAGAGET